jgi:hypothetical protein
MTPKSATSHSRELVNGAVQESTPKQSVGTNQYLAVRLEAQGLRDIVAVEEVWGGNSNQLGHNARECPPGLMMESIDRLPVMKSPLKEMSSVIVVVKVGTMQPDALGLDPHLL